MDRPVAGVRSVELGVANVDRSTAFYRDVWGLEPVARDEDAIYLRAAGAEHHVVVLRPRAVPGLLRIALAAPDRAAVERAYERLTSAYGEIADSPRAFDAPGGGYGFAFRDPEGRAYLLLADVERHRDAGDACDRPAKLSHVVINAADAAATSAFLCDALGLRVRDRTRMMDFLGCNADHHSLAVVRTGVTSLNHVAFELPSIDAVMRGSGRLKRSGFGIEWGVGRHGPGDNVFAYFLDPDRLAVEYTAEMAQIDDATYRVGTPEEWGRRPSLDAWGLADPPSERFRAASGMAPVPVAG